MPSTSVVHRDWHRNRSDSEPVDEAPALRNYTSNREPNSDLYNSGHADRRVFELLSSSLSQTGRKKKHKKDDVLLPYVSAGRWIPRALSPFVNITSMFWVGIAEATEQSGEPDTDSENTFISQFTLQERQHLAKMFNDVLNLVPGFREQMTNFSTNPDMLDKIIDVIVDAAKGARSDDTGSLKLKGVHYIPLNPKQDACIPPITNEKSKSDRGFNHEMIARLLCPRNLLEKYDRDPESLRAQFLDGTIQVVADDWPTFLYEEGVYDPNEIDKGLLRGHFLLRVFRHIFTSPSSALKDKPGTNATRTGNAKLHNMKRVTPSSIAYAAVQARFFLSTAEVWCTQDGDFNLEDFHSAIVQLFDPYPADSIGDNWATETLAWWDRSVFGVCKVDNQPLVHRDATSASRSSDRMVLLAQRAARRNRRLMCPPEAVRPTQLSTTTSN